MEWLDLVRGKSGGSGDLFPVCLPLRGLPVDVTIYSHPIATAAGTIDCWSYVTRGLERLGQREVIFTLKREPGEALDKYPDGPLEFIRAVTQLAQQGLLAEAGNFTQCGPGGEFFGGHVMYIDAQPLSGVDAPPRALAAILITGDEMKTLSAYGAARVMSRLARDAAYYPCPPWSDRARINRATPRGAETILRGVRRVKANATSVLYDGHNLRVSTSAAGRPKLQQAVRSWTNDVPIALLTDVPPFADGCLVWEPGFTGPNAVAPPHAKGERMAGCFLMLVPGQSQNEMRIIEDGFALLLSTDAATALREAITSGCEFHVMAGASSIVVDGQDACDALAGMEIVLLNPDEQLRARGVSTQSLGGYIHDLARVIRQAKARGDLTETSDVVVAVRPGRRSRVWTLPAVRQQLEAIPAPSVEGGPIALALRPRGEGSKTFQHVFPTEWSAAVAALSAESQQQAVTLDEILERAWPLGE